MDTLPTDVLKIVLCFIDTIPDALSSILVCKRWNKLLLSSSLQWRSWASKFWYKYKKDELHPHTSGEEYDIELAQRESKKEWLW
jgi:protoporphyrinogen oxidase